MKKIICILLFALAGFPAIKAQVVYLPIPDGLPQTIAYDGIHTTLSQNFRIGIYQNDTLIGVTDISESSCRATFPCTWDDTRKDSALADSIMLYINEKKYTTFR